MNLLFIISILFFAVSVIVWFLTWRTGKTGTDKKSKLTNELKNYQDIIDQTNDALMVIDIVAGSIQQVNPAAAKLLGYSTGELLKKSLFDLHPKEYLQASSSIVADVWEKGGLIYDNIPLLAKNGDLIPVECSAKVAPFAGKPSIVLYARDIRERLRLEKEIAEQRKEIDEKSKDILDSIEYSKRIQRSILLEQEQIKTFAPESFIFWQPREVVSGDFYWFINYQLKNDVTSESGMTFTKGSRILVVAAADCTGHGVPGAFMSIIGNTLLDQTTRNPEIRSPAVALNYVNGGLKKMLNKNIEDVALRDGMDIALCTLDMDGRQLEYAGANNPVYIVRDRELILLKPDKMPLTASSDSETKSFTNKQFNLQKNDCVYLFTDGYADQFGGEKGKKFMYQRFKDLLVSIHHEPMERQKEILHKTFMEWKGELAQVDDVLVIGVRV